MRLMRLFTWVAGAALAMGILLGGRLLYQDWWAIDAAESRQRSLESVVRSGTVAQPSEVNLGIARKEALLQAVQAKHSFQLDLLFVLGLLLSATALVIFVGRRVVQPLAHGAQILAAKMPEQAIAPPSSKPSLEELHALQTAYFRLNTLQLRNTQLDQENRQLAEALKQASDFDPLTQLLNRRSVQERNAHFLAHAKRNNTQMALILLDLDHFKEVHDKHGHGVGDMVLSNLAQVLKAECRGADLLARTGGEEFLILGIDCDPEQARVFAERLRERIHRSKFSAINGQKFRLTASFGVACAFAGELESFDALLSEADRALHVAKLEGRNRVVLSLLEASVHHAMRQRAVSEQPKPTLDRLDALAI